MDDSTRFWEYADQMVATHEIVIDRPAGSTHPRFPRIVYPLNYGYLNGTGAMDGGCRLLARLAGIVARYRPDRDGRHGKAGFRAKVVDWVYAQRDGGGDGHASHGEPGFDADLKSGVLKRL